MTSSPVCARAIQAEDDQIIDAYLVVRFCRYAGYQLELGDVDFAARIPAIQSGKYDFTTDMNVTPERMDTFDYGYMLPKTPEGDQLLSEIDDYLETIRASGELEEITRKWTEGPEEENTVPDYRSFPAPKGILIMATEGNTPHGLCSRRRARGYGDRPDRPFLELNGYGLQVELINYDGIQPSVMTGKVDFAAAGFSITPERAESINFSAPYYTGGTVMAVLKAGAQENLAEISPADKNTDTFSNSIVNSFRGVF